MIYTTCIIDDDPAVIRLMKENIEQTANVLFVGAYTDPVKAMNDITNGLIKADITFLDINMPGLGGVELTPILQRYTEVIYITGLKEHAILSYEQGVLDYILKPLTLARFMKCIDKLKTLLPRSSKPAVKPEAMLGLQIGGKSQLKIVKQSDIIYVKSDDKFVSVKFSDQKSFLCNYTMYEMEAKVSDQLFFRIQRSYLINMSYLVGISGNVAELSDGTKLTMKRDIRKKLIAKIEGR